MSETPRAILDTLVEHHLSVSLEHAGEMVDRLARQGYEIRQTQILDDDQLARVEALKVAKSVLSRPTGSLGLATALPTQEVDNLVPLARFVLTGSEYEDDIRVAVAEERAARDAAVAVMPPGEDPGPLGPMIHSNGGEWPTTSRASDG